MIFTITYYIISFLTIGDQVGPVGTRTVAMHAIGDQVGPVRTRTVAIHSIGDQVGPVGTRTVAMHAIGDQVGAGRTRSVTAIVNGLPDGFLGMENLFIEIGDSVPIPPEYGGRFINTLDEEAGIRLERYIEGYLVNKKRFLWSNDKEARPNLDQHNSIFGEKVWGLVKEIEPEAESMNLKIVERSLECYGVTGRTDCIIRRRDKASIIIDFKYTRHSDLDERYRNPSRKFALQLLLYQWMVGKEFKEKEGAQLYIIRYYKGSNVMVLYQYQPPEDLQYSPAQEKEYQPNVIDQVVENFKKSLHRYLQKGNKFEAHSTLHTEMQELQKAVCRKLQFES